MLVVIFCEVAKIRHRLHYPRYKIHQVYAVLKFCNTSVTFGILLLTVWQCVIELIDLIRLD